MIRSFAGKTPRVAPDAFVSETAYVVGDVEIGAGSSVWPGAVVRGDVGPIRVGRNTHVEDNAVLHSATELDVGDDVMIGHGAVVHCRRIGRGVLIANAATVLDDAEVGDECIVAAGAVVVPRTVAPARSFIAGVPAQVRPMTEEQAARRDWGSDFYRSLAQRYREAGL